MYLGVDNSGTVCKAVLFDNLGRQMASASEELPMLTPEAGHTERDMELLWQANVRVIRRVIESSSANPKEIKGVACTGHGKGLYLWGKDGRPAMNGVISTNSRAWRYPELWTADGTADQVFETTCQKILACQPVSLLCWLRDNRPDVYRKALELNPGTAGTVKMIFQLAYAGKSTGQIRTALQESKMSTPLDSKKNVAAPMCHWDTTSILKILRDKRYTGTYVAGKTRALDIGSRRNIPKDESDWVKIPDHHPAIVDRAVFDIVQKKFAVKKNFSTKRRGITVDFPS